MKTAFDKHKKPPQQPKTLTIQKRTDGPKATDENRSGRQIGIGTGTRYI